MIPDVEDLGLPRRVFSRLVFDAGISMEDLWFAQNGDDLVVNIQGTDDQITFDDYSIRENAHSLWLQGASSDTSLSLMASDIQQLVDAMAAFKPNDYLKLS